MMCFRPVNLEKKIECPDCQKKISPMGGIAPQQCPFCGASLPKPDQN